MMGSVFQIALAGAMVALLLATLGYTMSNATGKRRR
jgi:hypothetical protein